MAEFNENVDKNDFNKTPIYGVFDIKSDENYDHKMDPYKKTTTTLYAAIRCQRTYRKVFKCRALISMKSHLIFTKHFNEYVNKCGIRFEFFFNARPFWRKSIRDCDTNFTICAHKHILAWNEVGTLVHAIRMH